MDELTERERRTIDLAGRRYRYLGAREEAIRAELGETATRFDQRVVWLLEQPAALAYDPVTVRRLQRVRDARREARTPAGRLGYTNGYSWA